MTMLLLYGLITPGQPGWRVYGSDDPALRVLLRDAEEQDRRAYERAYLLTDDGKVLTARMQATVEDDQRLIWFGPFFDESEARSEPVGSVVVGWLATDAP